MQAKPLLSIVIPTYNSNKQAQITTDKLAKQIGDIPIEIILVDDGSIPPIKFEIKVPEHVIFKIIRCSANGGRSSARNTGIKAASANYVGMLDVDCVPDDTFVQGIAQSISSHYEIIFGHLYFKSSPFFEKFENEVQTKRIANIENWASELTSACVFVKKTLIESVGGFDEQFNHYGFEDRDFFLRLKAQNPQLKVTYNKSAQVIHSDDLNIEQYLKKFYASAQHSAKIFYAAHPEFYKKSAYFIFDWHFNPMIHWIPKFMLLSIISLFWWPLLKIFKVSNNYHIKKLCFKILKGFSYLKGTISEN